MKKRKVRSDFIRAAVTPEEKRIFEQMALNRKTTISEIIRQALHREVAQSKEVSA